MPKCPYFERTAFFINVYNAMVVHVTAAVGPFDGFFDQLTLFGRYSYDIGGHAYSCDDIEHGVLRGNRPGAASLGALIGNLKLSRGPFGPTDPRRYHVCVPMDPRVHFALVCGARSCPPIRTYAAASTDALEPPPPSSAASVPSAAGSGSGSAIPSFPFSRPPPAADKPFSPEVSLRTAKAVSVRPVRQAA